MAATPNQYPRRRAQGRVKTFYPGRTSDTSAFAHIHHQEARMVDGILPHHHEMIQQVTEHFQADPSYLALIIGGSVAKRRALPDSDLDIMLIVSTEEFAQRSARKTDHFGTSDLADLSL